jgi:hypothetical protein
VLSDGFSRLPRNARPDLRQHTTQASASSHPLISRFTIDGFARLLARKSRETLPQTIP